MTVIKFGIDVVTKKECLQFERKGVSFISKIRAMGEKFFDGEFIEGFSLAINSEKKGALFEVCFKETKKIIVNNIEKEVKVKKYFFVDYEDKNVVEIFYSKALEIAKSEEMNFYN